MKNLRFYRFLPNLRTSLSERSERCDATVFHRFPAGARKSSFRARPGPRNRAPGPGGLRNRPPGSGGLRNPARGRHRGHPGQIRPGRRKTRHFEQKCTISSDSGRRGPPWGPGAPKIRNYVENRAKTTARFGHFRKKVQNPRIPLILVIFAIFGIFGALRKSLFGTLEIDLRAPRNPKSRSGPRGTPKSSSGPEEPRNPARERPRGPPAKSTPQTARPEPVQNVAKIWQKPSKTTQNARFRANFFHILVYFHSF